MTTRKYICIVENINYYSENNNLWSKIKKIFNINQPIRKIESPTFKSRRKAELWLDDLEIKGALSFTSYFIRT